MIKSSVDKIVGKEIRDFAGAKLHQQIKPYARTVIDLGTGDGKFAYSYALAHPDAYVIGVDADGTAMIEISRKATRKGSKGGVPNLMFVRLAAEELPGELAHTAQEVYVNFPWGSLLAGVVMAEPQIMQGIVGIFKERGIGRLQITLSYDARFEPQMMTMYQLPILKQGLGDTLKQKYATFGLRVADWRQLTDDEKRAFPSSWPKKILSRRDRPVWQLTCELVRSGN